MTNAKGRSKSRRSKVPGSIYMNKNRWWWKVKLPGENKMIARPLKPVGSRFATSDRSVAEEVARDMWEHSVFESDRPVKDVHTIAELVRAYLEYAKNYYKGADGKVTREPENNKICSSFDGGVFFNAACRRVRAIET